jgi:hypothetical protein
MATGVAFYSFFGVGWLLAGVGHFGGAVTGVVGVLGLAVALGLVRAARKVGSTLGEETDADLMASRRKRFGLVNAVQWVLIAVVGVGCGAGGVPVLIMPLVAVVVGVHFFPLARVFAEPRMIAPGALLTLVGVAGLTARAAGAPPGTVFTVVGVGCALTLWSTAAWTVAGARRAP